MKKKSFLELILYYVFTAYYYLMKNISHSIYILMGSQMENISRFRENSHSSSERLSSAFSTSLYEMNKVPSIYIKSMGPSRKVVSVAQKKKKKVM